MGYPFVPSGFRAFLERVADSGVGPDGLPYSAWRAAGRVGVTTLFLCTAELMQGVTPPLAFNESTLVLPPKSKCVSDAGFVTHRLGREAP